MRKLKLICRGVRLVQILATFLLRTSIVSLINKDNIGALAELTHIYSAKILRAFNVSVSVTGSGELANAEPCLILSNHLSYLDILMLSSVRPSLFLSHTGIEKEPLIGRLATNGGTLFVNRSSKSKLESEMHRFAGMLKAGNTVTLFPEGTTGDGTGIMPFHSAFIGAAIIAEKPVLPICIQYESFNGEPITPQNKANVFIYGKASFLGHIKNIFLKEEEMSVNIHVYERIFPCDMSRKEISNRAREQIMERFAIIA
jgi:1-acyl-sn-glycerol-3-phosphate acyltransferase